MAQVPEIDVEELAALLETAHLIDVREPDEYAEARVRGAILIPLATIPDSLDDIPKDRTVHVICAAGGRSARAVEFLRSNGIDAVNIAGGTMAWVNSGADYASGDEPA
ncbi:MAG: rhodanese-like domain-containing protein [Actinobacteria bacterium]|uniref:Unannotated protein n=1 Tax=freshwater metagenome TaxID=449393 RepID=A0A6J5YGZ9_9ZZZZ|nr:rhodanese-like domain-containing protein [Actinomycetota bacterium]